MTMGWVYAPMTSDVGAYEKSVREYPNMKPGEEFKGYPKKVRDLDSREARTMI